MASKNVIREYPKEITELLSETHKKGTCGKKIQNTVRATIRQTERIWNHNPTTAMVLLGLTDFEMEQIHQATKLLWKFYSELEKNTHAGQHEKCATCMAVKVVNTVDANAGVEATPVTTKTEVV
jgi:hypothetical protein